MEKDRSLILCSVTQRMLKIKFTGEYTAALSKLFDEDQAYRKLVEETVKIFNKNPLDTRLKVHPLRKKLQGKWAISVTGDIRIVFEWIGKHTVRFLKIGSHSKVYARRRKKKK